MKNSFVTLEEYHKRRVARGGKALWNFILTMSLEKISGKMAMKIKDTYGFSPQDVIFICAIKGVEIDMEEFEDLLKEEFEKSPMSLCNEITL
jgi:alanyl-tRNA synthetase